MVQHALVTVIVTAIVAGVVAVTGNPADALTTALLPATPGYLPADSETAVTAFATVSEVLGR
jgi:hypothetical protein